MKPQKRVKVEVGIYRKPNGRFESWRTRHGQLQWKTFNTQEAARRWRMSAKPSKAEVQAASKPAPAPAAPEVVAKPTPAPNRFNEGVRDGIQQVVRERVIQRINQMTLVELCNLAEVLKA